MDDEAKNEPPEGAPAASSKVDLSKLGPLVIPIDSPLNVTFGNGRLDINVVMAFGGQVEGVTTVLRLTPEATGQLVFCIKKALDEGLISLNVGQPVPLQ